jgi:flagellar biosynthesis GTPase FlhF
MTMVKELQQARVDAINARASESMTQRKLADTEADLKQAKDEAARAAKEAQQAKTDAQAARQSSEADLKQAKAEAARATKEAQQAKTDTQAARQSQAEAERKLAEKQNQADPLGTWLRGLGAWLRGLNPDQWPSKKSANPDCPRSRAAKRANAAGSKYLLPPLSVAGTYLLASNRSVTPSSNLPRRMPHSRAMPAHRLRLPPTLNTQRKMYSASNYPRHRLQALELRKDAG